MTETTQKTINKNERAGISARLLAAEITVFSICGILFANIVRDNAAFDVSQRFAIFLAFALISGFFIKDISRKERQEEELTALTGKLSGLNSSLQEKIAARSAELEVSKNRSETIIDNLSDGLIEYDKDNRVLLINKAASVMLGVNPADVLGKKITEDYLIGPALSPIGFITFPDKAVPAESTETEMPTDANTEKWEIKIYKPAEKYIHILKIKESEDKINPGGFVKIIRDVTREKIVSINKNEFITVAAHQMRTPLSATKWVLNTLLSGDAGKLPQKISVALKQCQNTNESVIALINDLLSMVKIESGRFGYQFSDIEPKKLVREIADSYDTPAKEKNVSVGIKIPDGDVPLIYADEIRLKLAIGNILDNAITYTPTGGNVEISLENSGQYVKIAITDSGMGMSEDIANKIFTKFYRGENAIKIHKEGTGLGLFISKNIISRHGGTIGVQSKEGVGSVFTITLPYKGATAPFLN